MLRGIRAGWSIGASLVPFFWLGFAQDDTQPVPDFQERILPIFRAHCSSCHAGNAPAAGLDLMSAEAISKSKIVSRGNLQESKLLRRLTSDIDGPRMPMGFRPLSDEQLDTIRRWIAAGASFESSRITFVNDILPLMKARCGSCHNPSSLGGGLNLVSAEGIEKGGLSGAVIIPGKPEQSLLVKRLHGGGGMAQMPLGMKPLNDSEIKLISDWISLGGSFTGGATVHWSYIAPTRPPLPVVDGHPWKGNPIDAFVLSALKARGLSSSPPAPAGKMIRRLYLDVIGMPPSLEELKRDLVGYDDAKHSRIADRLLASVHYGEHQARYWLDLARYADTDGYEADVTRTAWKYRDWVIDAFNHNMRFDEFTKEQIAGDMLPNATVSQLVATGFHRNTMFNREGGVDPKESYYETILDRVNTTAEVWLGSTMQCARCHDHKYDPFTQRDYFRLYAMFANCDYEILGDSNQGAQKFYEPTIRVPDLAQTKRLQILEQNIKALESKLTASTPELDAEYLKWRTAAASPILWDTPTVSAQTDLPGVQLEPQNDGSFLAKGPTPGNGDYTVTLHGTKPTRAIRIEAIPDASNPGGGSGRASSGNFILSRISISTEGIDAPVDSTIADFIQTGYNLDGLFDSNGDTGWAVYPQQNRTTQLVIQLRDVLPANKQITLKLEFRSPTWKEHFIGRFRVTSSDSAYASTYLAAAGMRRLLGKQSLSGTERLELRKAFAMATPKLRTIRDLLAKDEQEKRTLEQSIPTAMILREKASNGPLTANIHVRGEFLSLGEKVTAGTPAFLPPPSSNWKANRLGLAEWLVSTRNPLTARVVVNRIWSQYFGRGLVETLEDFGTQGSKPSHPELLDWLAVEFMESGWNVKHIHKLIANSRTYRQDSRASTSLRDQDPDNVFLARGPRYRMDAEQVRDTMLVSGGLLNRKVGGPSVFPHQPEGVWNSPFSGEKWTLSDGSEKFRRAMYTFWKRTAPFPAFMALDATSRETCTPRRIRTNTPLQALALLNDPTVIEASRALAESIARNPDPRRGIVDGFRACTARTPSDGEISMLYNLFTSTRQKYYADWRSAKALGKDATEAAWVVVANVLLNLDETITKE